MWYAAPIAVTSVVLLIVLASAPWPVMFVALLPAAAAHAAIYDWSARRPDAYPAVMAFLTGFLLDIVSSGVFGLGALTCVCAHYGGAAQRRFLSGRGFAPAWLGLALTAVMIAPVAWVAASIYVGQFQPVGALFALTLLTAAIYPAVALALGGLRRVLFLDARAS